MVDGLAPASRPDFVCALGHRVSRRLERERSRKCQVLRTRRPTGLDRTTLTSETARVKAACPKRPDRRLARAVIRQNSIGAMDCRLPVGPAPRLVSHRSGRTGSSLRSARRCRPRAQRSVLQRRPRGRRWRARRAAPHRRRRRRESLCGASRRDPGRTTTSLIEGWSFANSSKSTFAQPHGHRR